MTSDTTISIAMATYNGARYIAAQLDSLLAQTRLPDELVVTDDGSSDDTIVIVERFASGAPFAVRCERNVRRLGPAGNFARALSLATGELVFLCDQDDIWKPEKIGLMSAQMAAEPRTAALLCDALLADGALVSDGRTKRGAMRSAKVADAHFVMGCCAVFRRELVALALPFPEGETSHDNWLVGLADALGASRRTDDVLQIYRLHSENFSDFFVNRAHPENPVERLGRGLDDLRRRLGGTSLEAEYRRTANIVRRLGARPEAATALIGAERWVAALTALKRSERVLAQRLAIRRAPHLARPAMMLRAGRAGDYAPGAKGALKDLLVRFKR